MDENGNLLAVEGKAVGIVAQPLVPPAHVLQVANEQVPMVGAALPNAMWTPAMNMERLSSKFTDQAAHEWIVAANDLAALLNFDPALMFTQVATEVMSAWSAWRDLDKDNRPRTWDGFKSYICEHRHAKMTKRGLIAQLIRLPTKSTTIEAFNAEFLRLVNAMGLGAETWTVGIYETLMPQPLRELLATMGPKTQLSLAMEATRVRVNAALGTSQRNAMEVDAINFGYGPDGSDAHQKGGGRMLNLQASMTKAGVSDVQFQDRLAKRLCLMCGGSGHIAANCAKSGKGQ